MKAAVLLLIFADVIKLLKGMGIIDTNNDFRAPTVSEDTIIAQRVETILVQYGVDIPDQVEKVMAILPLALALAGVK